MMDEVNMSHIQYKTHHNVIMVSLAVLDKCITKANCYDEKAMYANAVVEKIMKGVINMELNCPDPREVKKGADHIFKLLKAEFGLRLEALILKHNPDVEEAFVRLVQEYLKKQFSLLQEANSKDGGLWRILSSIRSSVTHGFMYFVSVCRNQFSRTKQPLLPL
ncbi:hypothetical protein JOB18_011031 [Solea senegalensis]|uniref:Uncharacterized protein n=1 Tax=Solea senegalensis TaxID=28829 RepID=A0AAV6QNA5_SOLSE|nr:hypothetical protein JOB18_011031 [Solea senegalensis]